jgi:hypothetical protein
LKKQIFNNIGYTKSILQKISKKFSQNLSIIKIRKYFEILKKNLIIFVINKVKLINTQAESMTHNKIKGSLKYLVAISQKKLNIKI